MEILNNKQLFKKEDLSVGAKIIYFFPSYVEIRKNLRKNHQGSFLLKPIACILKIEQVVGNTIKTKQKDFNLKTQDWEGFLIPEGLYNQIVKNNNESSFHSISEVLLEKSALKIIKAINYKTTYIKEQYSYLEQVRMQTDIF